MGYAYYEVNGKPCGYSVDAICEHEGCEAKIDRGLAYACGDEPGEGSYYCAGYFCGKHLSYRSVPDNEDRDGKSIVQVCPECAKAWKTCEVCDGRGFDLEHGNDCEACYGDGEVFDEEHWD